jgi:hypothetical protein
MIAIGAMGRAANRKKMNEVKLQAEGVLGEICCVYDSCLRIFHLRKRLFWHKYFTSTEKVQYGVRWQRGLQMLR